MSARTLNRPWYRHVWPWLLMVPPLSAILFWGFIISTMAGPPSLVVDDYAKIGLAYTEDRSRDTAAARLGVTARMQTDRASGHVSLSLKHLDDPPGRLRLTLVHPLDAERDMRAVLERNAAGIYHGTVGGPVDGRREVRLEPEDQTWRLRGQLPAASDAMRLRPAEGAADS